MQGRKVMLGLPTGFNYLDNMLCGLKGGEYIVIAARPGQGKTSIVLQMAEHLAVRLDKPVAAATSARRRVGSMRESRMARRCASVKRPAMDSPARCTTASTP